MDQSSSTLNDVDKDASSDSEASVVEQQTSEIVIDKTSNSIWFGRLLSDNYIF